jgi:hypothetical protein
MNRESLWYSAGTPTVSFRKAVITYGELITISIGRSEDCGEGMLGWWMGQAGSTQTLTTCPCLPPSITTASAILSHGFWFAGSLVLAPFGLGFLISNSILIPSQGSAFAGIPRRRNLD